MRKLSIVILLQNSMSTQYITDLVANMVNCYLLAGWNKEFELIFFSDQSNWLWNFKAGATP